MNTTNDCDANADCTDIDGSYTCACKTGDNWFGDGFKCNSEFFYKFLYMPKFCACLIIADSLSIQGSSNKN